MSDILSFDVTLAHKIKRALIRNGITDAADLDWLAAGDNIAKVRQVRLGCSKIVELEHFIDLSADPYLPDGWKLVMHRKEGGFKWSPKNIQLYFDMGQLGEHGVVGHELFKRLQRLRVLNANALDYLLAHPYIIPEMWKWKHIYFWGTVYSDETSSLCVRQLIWRGDRWDWSKNRLEEHWFKDRLSVLNMSSS